MALLLVFRNRENTLVLARFVSFLCVVSDFLILKYTHMPAITFKGDVRDASGAASVLTVNGMNVDFYEIYKESFTTVLNLLPGKYVIILACYTDGEMKFNISGNLTSVNPQVPETFDKDKKGKLYRLVI